jgi:hypothetical protein
MEFEGNGVPWRGRAEGKLFSSRSFLCSAQRQRNRTTSPLPFSFPSRPQHVESYDRFVRHLARGLEDLDDSPASDSADAADASGGGGGGGGDGEAPAAPARRRVLPPQSKLNEAIAEVPTPLISVTH